MVGCTELNKAGHFNVLSLTESSYNEIPELPNYYISWVIGWLFDTLLLSEPMTMQLALAGYFKGKRTKQGVFAKYDYMQEGKKSSAEIQLILNDHSVSVSGGVPALGLTSKILQIDCEKLKEIPTVK